MSLILFTAFSEINLFFNAVETVFSPIKLIEFDFFISEINFFSVISLIP
jgi:hypothetical protein